MNPPVRINGRTLVLFASLLFVFFIAGAYLGGVFFFIYHFLLIFLLLDLLQLVWSIRTIRYSQEFSTTHPVKGQNVEYTINLKVESIVPGCRTTVRFKGVRQDMRPAIDIHDLDFFPGANRHFKRRYTIQCPFRGIYTVGLDSLEIQDLLSMVAIRLPVWFKVFYVYPRLFELSTCRLSTEGSRVLAAGTADGSITDYTQFRSLAEYKPGENVRHLAWKKFAATGSPYLRTYETSSFPGISLYLDMQRRRQADFESLEAEDCSIEIMLAVSRFFSLNGIPVFVRLGPQSVSLGPDDTEFRRFLESTINIGFRNSGEGTTSLLEDLESDIRDGVLSTSAVVGIFRSFDQETLSFIEDHGNEYRRTTAVIAASALSEESRGRLDSYLNSTGRTNRLVIVRNSQTIREDLS